jgi:hypothetical protein
MSDIQKTELLRKRIQQLKEDTAMGTKESREDERTPFYFLTLFITRFFAFFGTQHYILIRTSYEPFGLWETFVIYLTLLTFISILKKQ